MTNINFHAELNYEEDKAGIPMETKLRYAGNEIIVTAKVDTGAAVCLFSQEAGRALGIPIEQGIPKRLGGLKLGVIDYDNRLFLSP